MHIDPASISSQECYKLLIGGILPRPIALVSTLSPDGRPNLAPFSFFSGLSSNPMTLLFCPANRPDGQEKDTVRNAKPASEGGTGEFVVSTVPHAIATRMASCAEPLEYGQSEWDLSGLVMQPSRSVRPARVAESLLAFECRTLQVVRMNPGVPAGGNIVIGQVVGVYAQEGVIKQRMHVDPAQLDLIGRMGGLGYCTTRQRFEIPMGREALLAKPPDTL